MTKTVYRIYDREQPTGYYFGIREGVDDNEEIKWPETEVPIPEELKEDGKKPRFSFHSESWYDYSLEANKQAIDLLRDEVKTQVTKINGYKDEVKTLKEAIESKDKIIAEQGKKIAAIETTHDNDTSDMQDQIVELTDVLINAGDEEDV